MARVLSADLRRSLDTARVARRRSKSGIQRTNAPKDYWTQKAPVMQFGRERFRTWLIPGTGERQRLDDHVEQLVWDDANAVLTGTIQLRDPVLQVLPNIDFGDEVMVEVSLTGDLNFIELWRMRIDAPYRDFEPAERTFQLMNALGWLSKSTDDFKYGIDKAHPKGWLASQIVLDLATKYQIPTGVIQTTTHLITKLVVLQGSPLDVISLAYKREKNYTHKRFVISCDHGLLNVLPLVRSPQLLQLGPTLIAATLQQQMGSEFATALTVRATGRVDKGKDKKGKKKTGIGKIVVKVESATAIAKFGYIHREVWAHDAHSVSQATEQGKRHMVLVGQPTKTLTLTHPGLPTIKRGDAIRALLPDPALTQVIFVSEARHTLNPGDYQVELTMQFTDPLVDAKVDKVTESRTAVAKKRARTIGGTTSSKNPTPPGAKQRANAPAVVGGHLQKQAP